MPPNISSILTHSAQHIVMDRSEIPQDPDVNRDFSWSSSQVIRSYWVHLWCSPSAGCVFSGNQHHQLGWVFKLSAFGPVAIHSLSPLWSATPTSPLVFGSDVFLFVYHFDRISGWLWVLFPPWLRFTDYITDNESQEDGLLLHDQ